MTGCLIFNEVKIHAVGGNRRIKVCPMWDTPRYKAFLKKGIFLLLFSLSVVSDSLWPHGLQQTRLPCPSLSPGVCSNSCPLIQWCYLTIFFLCCPLLLLPSIFPSIRVFSNELALDIRWSKHWSFRFSISLSSEYLGLIFFRTDWFESSPAHNSQASNLQRSAFFMVQLSHLYMTTGKTTALTM